MSSTPSAPVLAARHLQKAVIAPGGELHILNDVNLQVSAGEATAILGASGSGKSTLLGLLAGLDQPSGGEVSLLGESLHDLDEDRRARLRAGRVGFVFQTFHLLPGMTALENVLIALELADLPARPRQALELLDQVGLRERAEHYPNQLSGGEQQRVAIARAFASQPAVLFADEPTGNLDRETGARVVQTLFDLRERHHTSLILVTHDVSLAERCDQIYRLTDGKLERQA